MGSTPQWGRGPLGVGGAGGGDDQGSGGGSACCLLTYRFTPASVQSGPGARGQLHREGASVHLDLPNKQGAAGGRGGAAATTRFVGTYGPEVLGSGDTLVAVYEGGDEVRLERVAASVHNLRPARDTPASRAKKGVPPASGPRQAAVAAPARGGRRKRKA